MGRKIFTIVLFAVMVFVVGVTAASADLVTLPSAEHISNAFSGFLPIVTKSESPEAEGPVGALIVFSTTAKTTGAGGGRKGMNAKCAAEDITAHFCSFNEIENAILSSGVFFNTTAESWTDYLDYDKNYVRYSWGTSNCEQWTKKSTAGGKTINGNGSTGGGDCNESLSVACCKWVP